MKTATVSKKDGNELLGGFFWFWFSFWFVSGITAECSLIHIKKKLETIVALPVICGVLPDVTNVTTIVWVLLEANSLRSS